jgi:hypothetical protein
MTSSDSRASQHSAGDSFNLTLPSNVSHRVYPKNANGHYITRLDRPLRVARGEWVVGVSEMHFTKSWHNVDIGKVSWLEEQVADPNRPDHFLQPGEQLFLRKRLVLTNGLYDSVDDVIKGLTRLFVDTLLEEGVRFYHRKTVDRVYVSLYTKEGNVRQLTFSKDLCEILGFPETTIIESPGYNGTRSPDINRGMTGLYVYSNVVDNRLVGDAYVPLLRVVPLGSLAVKYDNVFVEFNNIQYHDVRSFHDRDVEIKIARDNGETVTFDKGKVIVNLHFKRIYKR